MQRESSNIIEVKKVNFSFGNNQVLKDVSFNVERGGYLGIIGPNGSGKSTLLKIILGLNKPKSGEVLINNVCVPEALDRCTVGYVPQRISQDFQTLPATVYEIVESGMVSEEKLFKSIKNKQERIDEALKLAGLIAKKDKLIGNLSGGQKQKAFIARSLVAQPQILILDEPFVGVDLSSQDDFYKFLNKLNVEKKLTIIFVSHDIDIITRHAKQIIALNQSVVYTGEAEKVDEAELIESIYGTKFIHIHHDR